MHVKGGRAAASRTCRGSDERTSPTRAVRTRTLEALARRSARRSRSSPTRRACKPFETDAFIAHRETPMLAVLPDTEAQVRAVVAACRALGVPVVSRGAGTGISGGAIPLERRRAARGVEDEAACSSSIRSRAPPTVEPGVRNLAVSEAAAPHGLFYAPDPSSQSVCSIGGNVAENSGGVHCLKYGLTTHNVLAVRAIDARRRA